MSKTKNNGLSASNVKIYGYVLFVRVKCDLTWVSCVTCLIKMDV